MVYEAHFPATNSTSHRDPGRGSPVEAIGDWRHHRDPGAYRSLLGVSAYVFELPEPVGPIRFLGAAGPRTLYRPR
jgi:hypothetical protein